MSLDKKTFEAVAEEILIALRNQNSWEERIDAICKVLVKNLDGLCG